MAADSFFISDLYLEESRPAVVSAFELFLRQHRDAASLYILGNLFASWIGDDDDSPLVRRVASALRAFSISGPQLFLMHGSRDFLLGERFAVRVGATLIPDPSVVESHHQQLLLMHGDSLCTRDTEYQTFRQMARSPQWQEDLLARPLAERLQIASQLREMNHGEGGRSAESIVDVTEREVLAIMQARHCAVMVHGHTLRPARHENRVGQRWVLGAWDRSGWYLRLHDSGFELTEFAIEGAQTG